MKSVELGSWSVSSDQRRSSVDLKSIVTVKTALTQQFGLSFDKIKPVVLAQHTLHGLVRPVVLFTHEKIKFVMTRITHSGEWKISVVSEKPIDLSGVTPFWWTHFPDELDAKLPPTGQLICRRRLGLWSLTNSYRFSLVVRSSHLHTAITLIAAAYRRAA